MSRKEAQPSFPSQFSRRVSLALVDTSCSLDASLSVRAAFPFVYSTLRDGGTFPDRTRVVRLGPFASPAQPRAAELCGREAPALADLSGHRPL